MCAMKKPGHVRAFFVSMRGYDNARESHLPKAK